MIKEDQIDDLITAIKPIADVIAENDVWGYIRSELRGIREALDVRLDELDSAIRELNYAIRDIDCRSSVELDWLEKHSDDLIKAIEVIADKEIDRAIQMGTAPLVDDLREIRKELSKIEFAIRRNE